MFSLKKTVSSQEGSRRVQRPAVKEAVVEPNPVDLQLRAARLEHELPP